jgi:hypothetical protein
MSHTSDTATGTDPFLDEEWLAGKGPRSRWRVALLTALAVAVVFLAGAQVQRHFGTSNSTAAAAPTFPGGQGLPAGFPAPGGAGTSQPDSAPSSAGQQTASLIGTVTRATGDTLQVKDFGGKTHTITIGTRPTDIKPGSTVVIQQATGSSQRHPATSITVR